MLQHKICESVAKKFISNPIHKHLIIRFRNLNEMQKKNPVSIITETGFYIKME